MWENIVVFKLLSFHAYIEICQCENKCMIFFHRFTIPDVSIAVYIRCEAADKTNAFYLILLSADPMHLCFWNIQPSCIIITSVTQSGHVRYILYHKLLVFCLLGGMVVRPLWPNVNMVWCFLVVERGLNSYSMSLQQLSIPSIPKERNKMYQKIFINRHIGIFSFTFVLTWK